MLSDGGRHGGFRRLQRQGGQQAEGEQRSLEVFIIIGSKKRVNGPGEGLL
ncbi:hypothetical protein M5585_22200 [Serratia ureilytica]